ncbi:MAG TPA: ADP/ATP-dependent (S)-NAD(P)H-hydrate dehydratase, partial [Casimicrobiaceae bacterium]|nr:ADP/ATP-dependent (S)-NAD(P)H-hydrate dehydratase [Casimicrobiaceae bacterium]
GLGSGPNAHALIERAAQRELPLVLDADALNQIARDASLRDLIRARSAPTLATPHPAEAARLLGVDIASIGADRVASARAVADALGACVVLKGAGSVLAYPGGSFDINASGGPALATAGSGDVLAGFLGATLAQGIDAQAALRLAVCLHGAAADRRVAAGIGPIGLVASDLADAARDLLNEACAAPSR